jgi:hypothetical protein
LYYCSVLVVFILVFVNNDSSISHGSFDPVWINGMQ